MRKLLELGWKLFLVNPDGFPYPVCDPCQEHRGDTAACEACSCLFCHSAYAATDDPQKLAQMYEEHPMGLLALRTGASSGVFVIDFDKHPEKPDGTKALEAWKAKGWLPDTAQARTGGGGAHLFYKIPDGVIVRNSAGKVQPGVDVRGDGGFVILPPSKKFSAERPYVWEVAPWECLSELPKTSPLSLDIMSSREEKVPVKKFKDRTDEDRHLAKIELENSAFRLKDAVQGERNSRYFEFCCRLGECVALGILTDDEADEMAAEAVEDLGLSRNEKSKTLRSGIRRGANDLDEG